MAEGYLPAEDGAALTWMKNFRDNINLNAGLYGLAAADAAAITVVVDGYESAFDIASNELTRTKGTIADKDDARATAETLCRQYAMEIKAASGVSDADKINVGVRPINTNREPIDPPSTFPLLNIIGNTPGAQTLRFVDSSTPESRSKPFGVSGMQLYRGVTMEEPADIAQCQFHSVVTRGPVAVEFNEADDGKMATYYARWMNGKGEPGPWSLPVSMRIAA